MPFWVQTRDNKHIIKKVEKYPIEIHNVMSHIGDG